MPPFFDPRYGPGGGRGFPSANPPDTTLLRYEGGGLYSLNDRALERLRPIFNVVGQGYNLSRIRVRFGAVPPGSEAYTPGDTITLRKSHWNELNELEQLKLLAHEGTHSAQANQLGRGGLAMRRLSDTIRFGPRGQYDVHGPLETARLSQINIIDRNYGVEALAERVSQFVAIPTVMP